MTTEVTKAFLRRVQFPTEILLTANSPPAEYKFPSTCPDILNFLIASSFISSRDIYPRQNVSQQFPFPRQQQCLDLKLGQIVHRRKLTSFYSPARDFDGLQIPPTRSPGSYQILSSRIYTQDSPVEHLLTSPQQGSCSRFSTTCFSISTIHSSI